MDNSSLSFVLFQVVSPKQWTTRVYLFSFFKSSVLNNGHLEFTFHFPKSVIPCFIRKRDVTQSFTSLSKIIIPRFIGLQNIKQVSFPGLSDYRIPNKVSFRYGISNNVSFPGLSDYGISNKVHSPIYQITEYQTSFIPRFIGLRNIKQRFIPRFIGLRNIKQCFIPQFIGLRNIKQGSFPVLSDYGISNKFHSPVYRITEYQTRFIPRFIRLRNIKQVSFPGLSDYGISNKVHSTVYRITEY